MGKPWSAQQKEFVRKYGAGMSDKELAEHIGRTIGAVQSFRYRNDIYKGEGNHYQSWTKEEEHVIRRYWPSSPKSFICGLLPGRTIEAITARARQMGISRNDAFRKATEFKPDRLIKTTADGTVTIRSTACGKDYLYLNTPGGGSIPYHRVLWKKRHGAILKGYCLKCKSGDTTNPDPENWELLSIKKHLARYADPESGVRALRNYAKKYGLPAKTLSDGFIAGVLAQGDEELKNLLLTEHYQLIKLARANYKLKREIRNGNS